MDNFNVITPTNDLNELDAEMVSWTRLPFKMRFRSDEECLRRYNMTNIDLYNKIKAAIISKQVPEDKELILPSIQEGTLMYDTNTNTEVDFDFLIDNDEDFANKDAYANQLEQSPNIVLIHPFRGTDNTYNLDELNDKYSKFLLLNQRNRRFSNSYSVSLWGYNVLNMYAIMKNKINKNMGLESEELILSESFIEKNFKPIEEQVENMIVDNDCLSIGTLRLDSCDEMSMNSSTLYNNILDKAEDQVMNYDFDQVLPSVVPYFTLDELNKYCPDHLLGDINSKEYPSMLINTVKAYENDKSLEEEVLKLGWNPSVKLNEANMKFARSRQTQWLNEHAPRIINIENLKTQYILETSMRPLYREKNLYPIYIVMSFSNTVFGNVIRAVKGSQFTHAGICLDSNLGQIMTYKFGIGYNGYKNEWTNGFHYESLETYLHKSKNAIIRVLCIFVDKNTKNRLESNLKIFLKNQEKSKYGFGNLFNILKNKEKENDPENLALVCSQFVDTVLKLSNIDLTHKSSNLVIPQDLAELSIHPKIYQVYNGYVKDYKAKETDDKIYSLFQLNPRGEILYSDAVSLAESFYVEAWCSKTENEKANYYIEQMYSYLLPEACITSKPIEEI